MDPNRLARAVALAAAALLCGCERAEPAPPERAAPQTEVAPVEHAVTGAVVIPPFDPSLPALNLEPPPAPAPGQKPGAPPIGPKRSAKSPTAPPPPSVPQPPLDALFRAPDRQPAGPSIVDLRASEPDAPLVPKPPGPIDRLGQSIRLERRSEAIGVAGPRQGTAFETEAGVRIPVDDTVSIEGGVRVDSRADADAKETDRRSTPRVGVEVRF
jgi:hypothetical protein